MVNAPPPSIPRTSSPSPVPLVRPIIGRAEITAVNRVLRSGQIAQGACVAQFEAEFAAMCGVHEAIAVNSGTAALFIALLAHGIGPGDEVITSPFTFAATANAVLMTGATPVFADIRETDFNIDPDQIPARITPRTKAIIPVHLYGHPADMTRISEIAQERGVTVIEDACQAHGAEWQGRRVGSFGTGCFSFYPTKNITTGEGGMVTTNDPQIAQRLHRLRSHGADRAYYHTELGYNFRMTDISAAIGLAQLGRLDTFTRKRRANARYYGAHLTGVIIPVELDGARHVYHQYTVRVPEGRDLLQAKLAEQGIGSAVYYPVPLHHQPFYRELGYADSLPVAEAMARQVLSLPIWPGLTVSQRERVARAVAALAS
ncbi:MAG TPA: DegT/DnrJ/EryC1/StrS family aminotransferase [Dehalococcoidia bacterium]|nr:DegT/DnrJ/EryC1/StrS family aminotransferase [Dehalococcoidia bacterium]